MARASFGGALGCALLALVLAAGMDLGSPPVAGFYPHFNPFFFLCTHHGELEGSGVAERGGEVFLTLQIAGDPTHYTPGHEYQVTVSTSTYFDGLLVTGLYTSTPVQSAPIPAPAAFGFGKSTNPYLASSTTCSLANERQAKPSILLCY
ncbi:reelin-like [Salvelinus namaycush]|uniref:Reelin-like n=1 Tax=Salvelinus namaycush TaxID=8040 RepID=A0A8U0U824_SALNM|nr:reelin-like [Salvelinus namaycush]